MACISRTLLIELPRAIATTKFGILSRTTLLARVIRIRNGSVVVAKFIVTPAFCDPS